MSEPERGRASMRDEVLWGLGQARKELPCKYFYDARGAALFERICELPEYYPTRTELGIMERHADEMAALIGPRCLVIEYGSGSSVKTRLLLDRLEAIAGYVPVDICGEHLRDVAKRLEASYPGLEVLPVCADFTEPFEILEPRGPVRRRLVYFPGSTIGNFSRPEARRFLAGVAERVGGNGGLLIGVDLDKDPSILEPAYDDSRGVTAEFNKNLLVRLNRELGADFDPSRFRHHAFYDAKEARVEIHLVSAIDQSVRIDGHRVGFRAGESVRTECSHKYDLEAFRALAGAAGFTRRRVWTDPEGLFSVQYLTPASSATWR